MKQRNDMITSEDAVERAAHLIRLLLGEVAKDPKTVRVESESLGFTTVILRIHADATNYGTVLGGQQAHLKAFKTICKIISDDSGKDIQLELVEAPGGVRSNSPFQANDNWPADHVRDVLQEVFEGLLVHGCRVQITDAAGGRTAIDVIASSLEREARTLFLKQKMEPIIRSIGLKNGRQVSLNFIHDSVLMESVVGAVKPGRCEVPDPMDLRGFVRIGGK